MEIKGTGQPPPPIKASNTELADSSKPQPVRSAVENWKTNQILKAIVTETNPQQTRLNIQGILAQTATPAKLELQVGQQLTVQVTSKNSVPDLKLLSIDKSPQQIVAEQLRTQLPRQQSITHLLSDIKAINARPEIQRLLPAEVIQQTKSFLAVLPDIKHLKKPEAIKQALQNSGLFLEQNLAQARQSGTENNTQLDIRSLLLRLATLLRSSLNKIPTIPLPPLQSSYANSIANTLHKQTPQAQSTVASRLADIANAEQLKLEFIKQIESSLARIQSLQLTSVKTDETSNPLWALELPVRNQESLDLFDIRIQQERQGHENDEAKHRWSLSIAFDLEGLGPVHVRVSWFNEKISAIFWINQKDAHTLFSEHLQVLQQQLIKAGLDIEQLNLNEGQPDITSASSWQRILDEKV